MWDGGRPEVPAPAASGPRRRRRWWRFAAVAAGAALSGLVLPGRLPAWSSVWVALRHADPGWLALGVVLQVGAMGAASAQQRRLLAALRVPMPARTSLAVTYVRAAISIGLPAGSALSTGYAFRQFRARGAETRVAVAALMLCAVASAASLALLYAAGLIAWVPTHRRWPVLASAVAAAAAVALVVRWARRRGAVAGPVVAHGRSTRLARLVATAGDALRLTTTITARQWCLVGAFATLNWVADAASLLAGVRAVGLATPATDVLTTYLAVQLIRQAPVASAGVTETSLVVALAAAGAVEAPAAAAVFIYRLLSCWAVLPVGLACWATQQARGVAETAAT